MPLHSIIISNASGNVLFSKYFQQSENDKLSFEQLLFMNTSRVWTKTICTTKQTVAIGSKYVVFQRAGDLLVFTTGIEEVDEIIRKS